MRAGARSRQPGARAESSDEHEVVDDERGREPASSSADFCTELLLQDLASVQDARSQTGKLESKSTGCLWRCKTCKKTMSVLSRDQDIFAVKVSLQTLVGALWLYTSNLHISPDKASTVLEIGHRAIRAIFADLNNFFVPLIERLSSADAGWNGRRY